MGIVPINYTHEIWRVDMRPKHLVVSNDCQDCRNMFFCLFVFFFPAATSIIYFLASGSQESRTVVTMSVVADSGFFISVLQLQWFQTCS